MRPLLAVPAVLAALVAASPATAKDRACGTLKTGSERSKVYVEKGHTSCADAKRLFKDLANGKGSNHPGSSAIDTYTTLRGWKCFYNMGISSCATKKSRVSARPA